MPLTSKQQRADALSRLIVAQSRLHVLRHERGHSGGRQRELARLKRLVGHLRFQLYGR